PNIPLEANTTRRQLSPAKPQATQRRILLCPLVDPLQSSTKHKAGRDSISFELAAKPFKSLAYTHLAVNISGKKRHGNKSAGLKAARLIRLRKLDRPQIISQRSRDHKHGC
ncbi:hypothetical protein TSAR_012569, partial [Trichomalopsis sarcophagae]